MSLDDQLAAFLGEAPKQSRADVFSAEVMKRVERQVFVDRLTTAAAGAVVFALVLWACSPVLNLAVFMRAPSLAPIAAIAAFVGAILVAGGPTVWKRLGLSFG
jgi:phosphate/sulfate permease